MTSSEKLLISFGILTLFSSPEPKAQVSFSDQNLSSVRRRRCCRKRFTFSSNYSSSQEPGGNFNQTWHKAFLGEGNSSLFKWKGPTFFQGEIITKLQKYIDKLKKSSSPEALSQF